MRGTPAHLEHGKQRHALRHGKLTLERNQHKLLEFKKHVSRVSHTDTSCPSPLGCAGGILSAR